MNFFEQQANVRRQSRRLLFMFVLAVVLTLMSLNLIVWGWLQLESFNSTGNFLWHEGSAFVFIITGAIIAGGSRIEAYRLRDGGVSVAKLMGARPIRFSTQHPHERQLINIVEEMAIASGAAVPALYVLDRDEGINAFVAGCHDDDTVLVVTYGALTTLERHELQALIGHEFSHILNGDMRLNFRLSIMLAGLVAMGQMGAGLFGLGPRSGGVLGAVTAFLGLLLLTVGSIGLFFGRLIKMAISRQREYLADASSVQFTRNPDGLLSVLLKISFQPSHSWLGGLRAESVSHMCFAEVRRFRVRSISATHPTLEERINALGQQHDVDRVLRQQARVQKTVSAAAGQQALPAQQGPGPLPSGAAATAAALGLAASPIRPLVSAALLARVGTVNPLELASAERLLQQLPLEVKQALHSSDGAKALLYALLVRQNTVTVAAVSSRLEQQELLSRVHQLVDALDGFDLRFALPLAELALPRLRLMTAPAQQRFMESLQELAQQDGNLGVFEFALLMLLRKQLGMGPKPRAVKLAQCSTFIAAMLAAFLRAGRTDEQRIEKAYLHLMSTVCSPVPAMPEPGATRLAKLAIGIQVLSGLSLPDKKLVLELVSAAVLADAEVRLDEYELLRVVAAFLDCPMPRLAG